MAFGMRKKFDKTKKKNATRNRLSTRRKTCRFCADKKLRIDYKDGKALFAFITERGKIIPRRISGACAGHQRDITTAVKRARILALIPFTATQVTMP